ncbi:MAG: ABC transporter ATP-binding protein/permease [Chloroflexi bacterium]|nr:ABC transporter ATP-binding protein/permease [Chloroflexota bacterium]MCC6896518.1 ABC transporter ATP-binding protein [Anaerolineae bacterium]
MSAEFIAHVPFKTNHSNPLRFILSHILRHPLVGILMIIGAFSNAALAVAVPYYAGVALNAVINGNQTEVIVNATISLIFSQFVRGCLQLMRNLCAETFSQRIERDVRDELYASLLGKSMAFHDMQPVGEIMARVTNDVREMNLMMNPGMNLIIGSGFFLIVPLFTAPTIYPSLVIFPAIFLVLYFFAQYRFIRTLNPIAQQVRSTFGDMNAHLAETLDGLQVVKGAAREELEIQRFNELVGKVRGFFIKQGYIEARYISFLLLSMLTLLGLIHAIYLYKLGLIDEGKIVTFLGVLFLYQFPVYSSLRSLSQVALGYAGAGRILSIIKAQTDLDQNSTGRTSKIAGRITFEHVSFGYNENNQSLHDISFTVEPGQTVAIVGQTGSGKSTITKLINRSYDVDSGRVLVDGIDVREWNLASLRSQISIIEQDIFLFSRSVADNIRFGKQAATRDEVVEVAKKAQAHEFIESFSEGYETVVGQRGVTLSGGQRQRIAIARAFLTDPPILILDDSTSAIDSATEDRIQQAIWAASKGRTTILITARLSQIRWADHIVVLRKGRVVAQGKHEELLASSDSYRRIFARYEEAQPQSDTVQG